MDTDRTAGPPATPAPMQDASPKSATKTKLNPQVNPLEYGFRLLIQPLKESLKRIEETLKQTPVAAPLQPVAEPAVLEPVLLTEIAPAVDSAERDELLRRLDGWTASLTEFQQATRAEFAALRAVVVSPSDRMPEKTASRDVAPSSPFASPSPFAEPAAAEACDWERILLGPDLAAANQLADLRAQFLREVTSGGPAARALAGQLLIVQNSTAEEFPERLRPVGEAYYRWRPRTTLADDPFETCLAAWLTRCGEQSSHSLTIELVRPGDRFDSTRHTATSRGAEIAAVHGWVVLRDHHKVYTKAAVTVR